MSAGKDRKKLVTEIRKLQSKVQNVQKDAGFKTALVAKMKREHSKLERETAQPRFSNYSIEPYRFSTFTTQNLQTRRSFPTQMEGSLPNSGSKEKAPFGVAPNRVVTIQSPQPFSLSGKKNASSFKNLKNFYAGPKVVT